jgi:hypothetical protein
VSLHANGVDGNASALEIPHHSEDRVRLGIEGFDIEIVVDEYGIGIGGAGALKRNFYIGLTDNVLPH